MHLINLENFFGYLPTFYPTSSEKLKLPLTSEMHLRNARKKCFGRCISESAFFLKKLSYFGSSFPKIAFRKFISEILRVLQIKQNSPSPKSFTLIFFQTQ